MEKFNHHQTDRETDRQTDRQTDAHTHRQTDRQADRSATPTAKRKVVTFSYNQGAVVLKHKLST